MDNDESELCPCGSGKVFEDCCKKEYDAINMAKDKLKKAMLDPEKAKELRKILQDIKK